MWAEPPKPKPDARPPEGAVADDAGAEQRSRLTRRKRFGQRVGEGFGHGRPLGVAAIPVPAGELGLQAEILRTPLAEAARPAGLPQPGDPHSLPGREAPRPLSPALDPAHHLVPGHEARAAHRELALHHVQVGPADAAGLDPDAHLARARLGRLPLDRLQGTGLDRARLGEDHRAHGVASR
jgi:hypothetical protein